MQRYSKYIMGRVLASVVFITFSLTGIIWLTQSLRFIDLIVNRGLNVSTFVYLSSLIVPSLLSIILPIALFVSVVFVYNRLLMDSELVIFRSAGISKFQMIKPVLYTAMLLIILGYFISLYLLPTSYREFKDLQAFIRDNYASVLLQEGVFNSPIKGLTVYIQKRDENNLLHGLLVHDNRDVVRPVTMMAETGQLIQTEQGPRFVLQAGNRQELDPETGQLSYLYFDSYAIELSDYTEESSVRWREPQERYLHELFWPDDTPRKDLRNKLLAEGHNRLLWPIVTVWLALLATSPFLIGEFNRRGQWQKILLYTVISAGAVGIYVVLQNVVTGSPMLAPAMYFFVFVGIIITLYALFQQSKGRH